MALVIVLLPSRVDYSLGGHASMYRLLLLLFLYPAITMAVEPTCPQRLQAYMGQLQQVGVNNSEREAQIVAVYEARIAELMQKLSDLTPKDSPKEK